MSGVMWTLATSRTPCRFGRGSAPRFEKETAEAFARDRPEELRLLERELAATWADVVAHALHWGSWEARRWAGKRDQRLGQRSAWIAVRLMNKMADKAMIVAISAGQGEVACKTIAEINAAKGGSEYDDRPMAKHMPAVEMEGQLLEVLTRQAMRKEDELIRGESLGEGPRRDELHPTLTRWAGGILDQIWGDRAMAVRHRVSAWTSSHLLAGTPVDPEKADQITLTLIDTLLRNREQPYGGPELRELIEHRLMMETEGEEQTSFKRLGYLHEAAEQHSREARTARGGGGRRPTERRSAQAGGVRQGLGAGVRVVHTKCQFETGLRGLASVAELQGRRRRDRLRRGRRLLGEQNPARAGRTTVEAPPEMDRKRGHREHEAAGVLPADGGYGPGGVPVGARDGSKDEQTAQGAQKGGAASLPKAAVRCPDEDAGAGGLPVRGRPVGKRRHDAADVPETMEATRGEEDAGAETARQALTLPPERGQSPVAQRNSR